MIPKISGKSYIESIVERVARQRNLKISSVDSETKRFRFESDCYLGAEVSSLQ